MPEESGMMKSRSASPIRYGSFDHDKLSKDLKYESSSMTSDSTMATDIDDLDLRCGYAGCKPECLQKCNNSKCLLATICWFVFVQSFVVSGIVNVNTATLERRFDLSSHQVAWISSSYDLCGGVLSFIVGYLATFVNKTRMMTISAAVMALGSFVMFLPHVIVDPYSLGTKRLETCNIDANATDTCSSDGSPSDLSRFVFVLITGQVLHGVGGVTAYTVGTPVVDESTSARNSPVYIGIMHGTSALGPAIGFLFGGVMLHYYVDFDRIDMSTVDVGPEDPRWVGAWWVGFAVAAVAGVTVVILLGCFAEELPETAAHRLSRVSEAYAGKGEKETQTTNFGQSWGDFLMSLRIVFCNPTWVFMTVAAVLEAGIVQAFATFMPKVLQFQFSLSPGKAALIAGSLIVPAAAIGQVLGGFIPRWFNLKVRGLTLQCAVGCGLTLALSFTFVFRCQMQDIAGVTVQYFNSSEPPTDLLQLCNADCGCTLESYEPVCGSDGVQYFSSCHAGCTASQQSQGQPAIYYNCSCIPSTDELSVGAAPGGQNHTSQWAKEGQCKQDCDAVKIFLPFVFLMTLGTFVANTAFFSVTMRVVPSKQRAFACGLQGTLVRFLGATPFPLIFGLLFDQVCLVWQETCDERGSCWIYDNSSLGKRIMYMIIAVKAISTVSFFIAFLVYKAPNSDLGDSDEYSECIVNSDKVKDDTAKVTAEADAGTVNTFLDPDENDSQQSRGDPESGDVTHEVRELSINSDPCLGGSEADASMTDPSGMIDTCDTIEADPTDAAFLVNNEYVVNGDRANITSADSGNSGEDTKRNLSNTDDESTL